MDRSLCIKCGVNQRTEKYYFCLSCLERKRRSPLDHLSNLDFGWLVGILEGEASFTTTRAGKNKYIHPCIKVSSTDEDTIKRIKHLVIIGYVFGPYTRRDRSVKHKPSWSWSIVGKNAATLMFALKPFMGLRRQKRITELLVVCEEERTRAREFLSRSKSERMTGEGNPFYGRNHSLETKKNISSSLKKWWHSEETKQRMSESQKTRWERLKEQEKLLDQ